MSNFRYVTKAEYSDAMEDLKSLIHKVQDEVRDEYRGLAEYLLSTNETRVALSYSQIEDILGFALPDTARKFKQSYWANTETHSYASSWMAVGYKARVDTKSDTVTFIKNLI